MISFNLYFSVQQYKLLLNTFVVSIYIVCCITNIQCGSKVQNWEFCLNSQLYHIHFMKTKETKILSPTHSVAISRFLNKMLESKWQKQQNAHTESGPKLQICFIEIYLKFKYAMAEQ